MEKRKRLSLHGDRDSFQRKVTDRSLGTGASGDVSSFPREASGRSDTILPVDLIASDVKLRTLPPIWKVKLTHGEEQSQVNHRNWMTRFLNFYLKLTHFRVICGSFSWSSQLPATEGILTDTAILLKGTGKREHSAITMET